MSDPDDPEFEEFEDIEDFEDDEEPREEKLRYEFVPYDVTPEDELYAYRDALTAHGMPQQESPQQGVADQGGPVAPAAPRSRRKQHILMALATIGCLVLATLAIVSLQKGPPPPPIVDLRNSSVANSGLSGDFVARWVDKPGYVFYLTPLTPGDLGGFAAVAANPPRQISFDIHLKDNSGITLCEKEIIFPFKAPLNDSAIPTQGPPQRTMDGNEILYERGDQGEIVRIEVKGAMTCAENLYERIAAWDFTSTYPARDDQDDWVKSLERNSYRASMAKRGKSVPMVHLLPAPIDGDDVIVGDNPSRGTVSTRAGREFFVGLGGLSTHGQSWGFFPAAIHFHCDVKSTCTLTRAGAEGAVSARLMK